MVQSHKVAALEEFRLERAELAARVEKLTHEREEARQRLAMIEQEVAPLSNQLRQLDLVIEPLSALVGVLADAPVQPAEMHTVEDSSGSVGLVDGEDDWEVPEVFKRYMPKGGTANTGKRKRLRSTLMISDVVDKIGEPVTREQLRDAVYQYFGRDEINRFWDRPDNTLNTAIIRARDENLIIEIKVDGKPPLYTRHFRESETGEPAFPAIHIEEGR